MPALPDRFELPFLFSGDPVMRAVANGLPCRRCVLDTGAASTVLRLPSLNSFGGLSVDQTGTALLNSLRVGDVEFGPLAVRVKCVPTLKEPEIYLGTREVKTHCLVMDYQRQVATFDIRPISRGKPGSPLSFIGGRPVVSLFVAGTEMKFVLDSGSNANWIFLSSQNPDLMKPGLVQQEDARAECGLGDIDIRRSLLISDLSMSNRLCPPVKFYLASENDFGGPGAKDESGILGTGQIASWHKGIQIIDFVSGQYFLADAWPDGRKLFSS